MGATAVGATIYFGSEESRRQIVDISKAFEYAHELGMATILWCYLRNDAFKKDGIDYSASADLTGQANHLGVTIQADIIKQKLPEGFQRSEFLLEKGQIDLVVDRREMKSVIARALRFMGATPGHPAATPAPAVAEPAAQA